MKDSDQPREFLYAVLNLPVTATSEEIRAQYRTLSVTFHPDKHHGVPLEATSQARFLEIQKAYEVLSDPFLRVVYDTLGERGLKLQWPADLASQSPEEIRRFLIEGERSVWQREREAMVRPRGHIVCGVEASTLTNEWKYPPHFTWRDRLGDRIHGVGLSQFNITHNIHTSLNEKTQIVWGGGLLRNHPRAQSRPKLSGTILHQYNPRITFTGITNILAPQSLKLAANYRTNDYSFGAEGLLMPALFTRLVPPPLTFSLSRRLSRKSLTEGTITYHTGALPYFACNISTTAPPRNYNREGPGSQSGLVHRALHSSYGFTLSGRQSGVRAEWGWTFVELAIQATSAVSFGFHGLGWEVGTSWTGESSKVNASVDLNAEGVTLQVGLSYLEQQISLPITLSHQYDPGLAIWTTAIPLTALFAGYYLVFKPRHIRQRARHIHNARTALNEDMSEIRRDIEQTREILKQTARRHMDAEQEINGLVIVDAFYGSEEHKLLVDVTVPLQALVYRSQLHIPGQRSKAGLQGFYDPAPHMPKTLRVNYTFRKSMHYAEFSDFAPVVLPLEAHAVQ